ncbi:hypothetical protein [Streptomyces sp. CB03238]|uniref:hypothetical protein n=1 Tax=Streptomyces sp. CB03238 TaxID=1907777 RepID=UPI00117F741B|nr:hypothetical protein [Streptomyces sp. CB03238]
MVTVASYAWPTIHRYVDWDPASAEGSFFSAEQSAKMDFGTRAFSGGGGRIFVTGEPSTAGEYGLKSHQDKSELGGNLLTPEYKFELRAGQNFSKSTHLWSDRSGRVVNVDSAGAVNVYVMQFPDGTPDSARMSRLAQMPADHPAAVELRKSTQVWAAGDKVYGLLNGTIRSWDYSAALNSITLGPGPSGTVVLTGLTDAVSAWSSAPGVFNTRTAGGTVRRLAGTPTALVNDDVAVGLKGSVFAGAAACLSRPGDEKPYFGQPVDDSDVPPVPAAPTPSEPPTGPEVVSGRFLLPNGTPAVGMKVLVEAADLMPEDDSTVNLPDLGTAMTDANGNWSLTLPDTLPAAVQTAVDNNGGALNVTATTVATTESGVTLVGTNNMTAAPKNPSTGARSTFAVTASAAAPPTAELLPTGGGDSVATDPTPEQEKTTHAARVEAEPRYDAASQAAPLWQNDRGSSAEEYNPYLVDGVDIRSQRVTPRIDTCSATARVVSRQISYTVAGESHAYWDAAGNVEYTSKLSNSIDVGYSVSGQFWKVSGSMSIASSASGVSGFSWRGPYFAKQWKVPIEYNKIRKVTTCGGLEVTDPYYEIRPSKFKIPAGGAPGVFGKDARHLDGPTRYAASNPRYRSHLTATATWALEVGKSVKYSGAAEVFGFSLGGSVMYDHDHKQNIRAGGRTARKHYIWGYSAPPGAQMGVIYSN